MKENKNKKKGLLGNQSGFTLVELVIVVIILGVLAAVAVPKMMAQQGDAVLVQLQGDLRSCFTDVTKELIKSGGDQACDLSTLAVVGATFNRDATTNDITLSFTDDTFPTEYAGNVLPSGVDCTVVDNRKVVCE